MRYNRVVWHYCNCALLPVVDYQEYPPIPALRAYLACVWTCHVASPTEAATYRVLPDNCIDILWHGDNIGVTGFATGMMTMSNVVTLAPRTRIIAVRFKPGRAPLFFRQPLHELTDLHADMQTLWGNDVVERLHHALWDDERDDLARLHIVQKHLLAMLQGQQHKIGNGLIAHAVQMIEASHGMLKIEALAQDAGVTRQHLAARFRTEVGIPAKTFARICRFRSTMSAIRETTRPDIDWAALAVDRGYFDQSHLIHEFQEFAAETPESFANRHPDPA
jgi:AraC-like DNA-binding protein